MHLNIQFSIKGFAANFKWNILENVALYRLRIFSEDGLLCYSKDIYNNNFEISEFYAGTYFFSIEAFLKTGSVIHEKSEIFHIKSRPLAVIDENIKLLIKNPSFHEIYEFIYNKPLLLKYVFLKFRSIFHSGGVSTNKYNLLIIFESIFKINESLLPSQKLFLLSVIVYGKSSEWLIENSKLIIKYISMSNIPDYEKFFLEGLLNYKIGNFYIAQKKFSELLNSQKYLQNHQYSSLNYVYHYNNKSAYESDLREFFVHKKAKLYNEGVVLISCDWGYYLAYHSLIDSRIRDNQLNIHYHLVLPEGLSITELDENINERVGLSYEFEPLKTRELDKNYKTYYSVVRYLVANQISRLYDQKILISDIDIDFKNDISDVFQKITDDEAAIVFSKSDLPWTKIMAGFNVFGRDFFSNDFYILLCNFIKENLDKNLNFWMLDQMALNIAYVNSSKSTVSSIKSMHNLISFKILQQEDNSKYKYLARDNIVSKISELKEFL